MKFQVFLAVGFSGVLLSSVAHADEIEILAGDLPPMIFADGSGREAELIKGALERCGHTVRFTVQPFTRHWKSYEAGTGDAVATVPIGMPLPGTATSAYIEYQNGVSYLAGSEASFSSLDDLAGRSVLAFKGASDILPGLGEASAGFSEYREVTDQITQSRMLFGGRVDAIIGDGMLFAEYNRQLGSESNLGFDPAQPVSFQAVFDPSPYGLVFRDAALAADFERCFGEMKADGSAEAINKAWVEKYRETLGTSYLGY
ncbi:polar amino acid ABC transporter [Roseibium aquae]|uniref:Polar amino acid ABC transporter n=1 Tax=Roseibium aquae TaxID=1323746 RepID=A0A916TKS7_9HYPH|nr:transporter substrate-binding domain-containing protein [Roseibium aquae]GGB51466.1 polar amino acid ABC transporter [Roseibium aquae]